MYSMRSSKVNLKYFFSQRFFKKSLLGSLSFFSRISFFDLRFVQEVLQEFLMKFLQPYYQRFLLKSHLRCLQVFFKRFVFGNIPGVPPELSTKSYPKFPSGIPPGGHRGLFFKGFFQLFLPKICRAHLLGNSSWYSTNCFCTNTTRHFPKQNFKIPLKLPLEFFLQRFLRSFILAFFSEIPPEFTSTFLPKILQGIP